MENITVCSIFVLWWTLYFQEYSNTNLILEFPLFFNSLWHEHWLKNAQCPMAQHGTHHSHKVQTTTLLINKWRITNGILLAAAERTMVMATAVASLSCSLRLPSFGYLQPVSLLLFCAHHLNFDRRGVSWWKWTFKCSERLERNRRLEYPCGCHH